MRRTLLHQSRPPEHHDSDWVLCPYCSRSYAEGPDVCSEAPTTLSCRDCGQQFEAQAVRSIVYVTRGLPSEEGHRA